MLRRGAVCVAINRPERMTCVSFTSVEQRPRPSAHQSSMLRLIHRKYFSGCLINAMLFDFCVLQNSPKMPIPPEENMLRGLKDNILLCGVQKLIRVVH